MTTSHEKQAKQEQFEAWLAEMDNALRRFLGRLPEEVRIKLDHSPASLDVLEAWMLDRYQDNKPLHEQPEVSNLDGLARYVGETYRKALGGHWEIRLDDPTYVYYGLPQLTGFSEHPTPASPHTLVSAAVDRRTGKYLGTVLGNMTKRYKKK
jgi:hypothetical protein